MVKAYDSKLIGKLFAFGGENFVFRYGEDRLIKFPFGVRYVVDRHHYCEKIKIGAQIFSKYYAENFPETELLFYGRKNHRYVTIQKLIKGRLLYKKDLENEAIKRQFAAIVEKSKEIEEKEKLVVDFFGGWRLLFAAFTEQVGNMVVENGTNKIYVVDFGVFGKENPQEIFLVRMIEKWAIYKQKKILSKFLE